MELTEQDPPRPAAAAPTTTDTVESLPAGGLLMLTMQLATQRSSTALRRR